MQNASDPVSLAGSDPDTVAAHLTGAGIDPRYARRLLYWVYRRRIGSFAEINDMPGSVISRLQKNFTTGLCAPVSSEQSSDGSVKYLFRNKEGLTFETVYLPEGKRHTVCVSVQSGCRMGCRFCATGMNGWSGNLTAGEIVNQVISVPHEITHVVMMGMGEPGDNIDEVIKACHILTAEWGLAQGNARVTVSTVGIRPSLTRLLDETRCNVTLSLHSPFPEERRRVIPAEAAWPFEKSLALLKERSHERRRRFSVAYVMIKGINDTDRHLEGIRMLLTGSRIKVNLLPYHPLPGERHGSSDDATMMRFKHLLVTSGTEATIRSSRGSDISAACGMLAAKATYQ